MFMKVQVNLKEKKLIRKTVGFAPTTKIVEYTTAYTTLTTRPLHEVLLGRGEIIQVHIATQPKKEPNQSRNSV